METEDVRIAVYRSFAITGCRPDRRALAQQFGADDSQVQAALHQLADSRHLVLDRYGHIVMAHPFSAVPLGFVAMGAGTLWRGGCAWDSFALPHLLQAEESVLVATRCPACQRPHAWDVNRNDPPDGHEVAHFLVPAAHMWDDVVYTCRNQRLFCNTACVDSWLTRTGHPHGYTMDLSTLWRLAEHWYDGRLDRGYVRREPAVATGYLRAVGLSGAFWGL